MKFEVNRSLLSVFAFFSIASSCQAADESRVAGQAMNCAAVFSLLSDAHATNEALATKFGRGISIFTDVYLKERNEEAGSGLASAHVRRAQAVKEMRETLSDKAAYFREDAVICGAWAEGFMVQGERVQFMLVYPKVVPMHIRPQYQSYADEAITANLKRQ